MNWTEEQLAEYQRRHPLVAMPNTSLSLALSAAKPADKRLALGRLKTGEMNKTEAAYDAHLWQLRHAGEILWHKFEGIKLRLADNTFLTVDFAVLPADGVLTMHEVKGGPFMDDAKVKIKVAAALYPFKFLVVRRKGAGWSVEEF